MSMGGEPRRWRLRVMLPAGELPQWVGDFLIGLDRLPEIRLEPVPDGAQSRAPVGAPWWHARVPALRRWRPDAAWRERLDGPWPRTSAPDFILCLGTAPPDRAADAATAVPHWVVVDDGARALDWPTPRIDAACRGEGWPLQLLEQRDAGSAWHRLRRAHVAARPAYAEALKVLPGALVRLVRQALVDAGAGVARPEAVPEADVLPRTSSTGAWPWLCGRARGWMGVQRARVVSEYWRVGVIDAPIHELLDGPDSPSVRWLMRANVAGYWADPFGMPGDASRLTCEFFDERTGVGHLEVLQVGPQGEIATRTRLAVGGGRHTSFPNVFEVDGRRLGVAESIATRECLLHEVDADGNWRPLFALLHGVAVVDPSLFRWEGRWWLAFTDADLGDLDNLSLWYADRLEGPWQAHANNPVKTDIAGARMAGRLFEHAGALYRPAQDCLHTYGASVVLKRIVRLTPTEFEEVEVRRLLPDPSGPCPHGLHTLTAWGDRTLIDGKAHGFNPLNLWRKVRRRAMPGRAGRDVVMAGTAGTRRLAVYIPHLRTGGGEISMLRLAEGLAAGGLEVDLIVHELGTSELVVPQGINVISLDCGGTISAVRRLASLLRDRRPQWLLSAFPHTNVASVAAMMLSGIDGRCILSEHAPLSRQIAQQGGWRYRLLPPLVRWAYRRAHAVVAVSTGVRDDLQPLLGPGVAPQVIGNPVLVRGFETEFAHVPEHPWLADASLRVVLSVCRLSVEKDLPTLLRAFDEVHRRQPATRLVLAGEGPDRARLQALIEKMGLQAVVSMPGWTARPLAWMHRAAVFVLASRYEGFGNVLVEALAAGTPVVATDCPVGPREVLVGGRYGALVPVGDVQAMALAIDGALDRRELPEGARAAALRYSQDNACAAYLRLFESLYAG